MVCLYAIAPFGVKAQSINVKSADGLLDTVFRNASADLQRAIDYAPDGSTLTLSGGSFSNEVRLTKKLKIVGAGYLVDSTQFTGVTSVTRIDFGPNSSGSSIEGLKIINNIFFNSFNGMIEYIVITRCYIESISNYMTYTNLNSCIFKENIIGDYVIYSGVSEILLANNVIKNAQYIANTLAINNIFTNLYSTVNSIYKNNIFLVSLPYPSNCLFQNNVGGGLNTNDNLGNSGSGNFLTENLSTLFVNYTAPTTNAQLLDNDYHLTVPYLNTGGTDGKPIGIYGGSGYRVKPSNPFIEYKNVAPQTNAQGLLPVNFRVKAQGSN